MLKSDILEQIGVQALERVFEAEWKHEVRLYGCSSQYLHFKLDGKEYVLVLHEVEEGHSFSEYLRKDG